MEDSDIVELYWMRSEQAISETEVKYGSYCNKIAFNICGSKQDSEECVSDTWFSAWNQMPTKRPKFLSPFLGAICRNIAINRTKRNMAEKRGNGQVELALSELEECIADDCSVEREIELNELKSGINSFVKILKESDREIFIARYWHMSPIAEIAEKSGFTESNIKVRLHRIRLKLKKYLKEEGLC